jgi:hypothetical protein
MSIYLGTAEINSLKLGTADVSRVMLGNAEAWSAVDPDAADYFARIVSAGSSISVANKAAVDAFVRGCKTDGIWTAIKASCLLAGPDDLTGALVPLVGAAPTNVGGFFVSGDYNKTTGLAGNGSTKSLNSNRNNNADPQNSKHICAYATTASTVGNACYLGIPTSSGSSHLSPSSGNVNVLGGRLHSTVGISTSALNNAGLVGFNRNSSTGFVARGGGSTTTLISNASATPASGNILVFDGLTGGKSAARLSYYSIGESLDLALLDARLATYMSSLT